MKIWPAILFLPLLGTSLSYAAIGKVTEQVNTPPSIQRANQTLAGAKGTSVEMNDSIKTQAGKVGITFEDDTKVQVNENSRLVIDDFVYDPKTKAGKLGAKIALGKHSNSNNLSTWYRLHSISRRARTKYNYFVTQLSN